MNYFIEVNVLCIIYMYYVYVYIRERIVIAFIFSVITFVAVASSKKLPEILFLSF